LTKKPLFGSFVLGAAALALAHSLVTGTFGVLVLRGGPIAAWAAVAAAGDLVVRIMGLVASSSVIGFFPTFVAIAFWGALAASLVLTSPWQEMVRRRLSVPGAMAVARLTTCALAVIALVWIVVQAAEFQGAPGLGGLFGAAIVERWSAIAALHVALAIFSFGAPRAAFTVTAVTDLVIGPLLLAASFSLEGGVLIGVGAIVGLAVAVGRGRPSARAGELGRSF
jgi:hypothetical protein